MYTIMCAMLLFALSINGENNIGDYKSVKRFYAPNTINISHKIDSIDGPSIGKQRQAKVIHLQNISNSDIIKFDRQSENNISYKINDPSAPLNGLINECLFKMSFQCVQKKFLVYLSHMSNIENFDIIGEMISVVRVRNGTSSLPVTEEGLQARLNLLRNSPGILDPLVDYSVNKYLDNHVLRIQFPSWTKVEVEGDEELPRIGSALDLKLSNSLVAEGRGKGGGGGHGGGGHGHGGGGGGGKKGKKKMMMAMKKMIGLILLGKLGMMVPMVIGSVKIMAVKGMLAGMTSLLITIIMKVMGLIKGAGEMKGKGGGMKGGGMMSGPYPPSGVPAGGGCGGGCGGISAPSGSYGPPSGGCGGGSGGGGGGFGGGGGGFGSSGCGGGSIPMISNSYGPPIGGGGFGGGGGGFSGGGGGGFSGGISDTYGAPSGISDTYGAPSWSRGVILNPYADAFRPYNTTEDQ